MHVSLLASAVVFPFATVASICRSKLTICSGLCSFPRAIQGSSHTSLSHRLQYKSNRAFQTQEIKLVPKMSVFLVLRRYHLFDIGWGQFGGVDVSSFE